MIPRNEASFNGRLWPELPSTVGRIVPTYYKQLHGQYFRIPFITRIVSVAYVAHAAQTSGTRALATLEKRLLTDS